MPGLGSTAAGERQGMTNASLLGSVAAAGTTALNAVPHLDMAARGRPASSARQNTVRRAADKVGVAIPGGERSGPTGLTSRPATRRATCAESSEICVTMPA